MKYFPNQKAGEKDVVETVEDDASALLESIVARTGRALARSQSNLDRMWLQRSRDRLRTLRDSGGQVVAPQPVAYAIPEATLDLKLEIRGNTEGEGETKLVATPVNVGAQRRRNMKVELSSNLKLKFVLLPPEERTEATGADTTSAALPEARVLEIARADLELQELIGKKGLAAPRLGPRYRHESRKWSVELLDADRVVAVLLIDDSTGDVIDLIDYERGVRSRDIEPLGPPRIQSVVPAESVVGDIVQISGENLGGIDLTRTRVFVGERAVDPLEITVERIQFRVDEKMLSGRVRVITPEGDTDDIAVEVPLEGDAGTGDAGAGDGGDAGSGDTGTGDSGTDTEPTPTYHYLIVRAKPQKMEPPGGYFDPVTREGSVLKVHGTGLNADTELEFPGGATVKPFRLDGPNLAFYKVPGDARSGPVALLTRFQEQVYRTELPGSAFLLRPYVRQVTPLESRAGQYLTITGNHLEDVVGVAIGSRRFFFDPDGMPSDALPATAIVSRQMIALEVPPDAGDGSLALLTKDSSAGDAAGAANFRAFDTKFIFYQVPSIIDLPVYAVRGEMLEVTGYGFGEYRESLRLRFQTETGYAYSEVLYLERVEDDPEHPRGMSRIGVRVPVEAVTGPVVVTRAEILSEAALERTAALSSRKLLVWQAGTVVEDILLLDLFDADGT